MGERIRKFRQTQGWTQLQFAVKLNVALTTVVRWEAGSAQPSALAMDKLKTLGFKE